jgi:hypothetical protein
LPEPSPKACRRRTNSPAKPPALPERIEAVWQIHSRLRIDLPGDFAHDVRRSVHLIQRLRLIA